MSWRDQALAHALADAPREACGLVVSVAGEERYFPCRNVADSPSQFTIAPEDWAAAEDAGELLAVFHSHPNMDAHPSAHDRASCTVTKLPWHIVGLPDGVWTRCDPENERAPLIGRAFVHGIHDCYALIRDYYAEVLHVDLPDFPREQRWWTSDANGPDLYRQHFQKAGFRQIPAEQARVHDVVVMQIGDATKPGHGGVLLDGGLILHHVEPHLSCRGVYGGYWRERTLLWLRHESQPDG